MRVNCETCRGLVPVGDFLAHCGPGMTTLCNCRGIANADQIALNAARTIEVLSGDNRTQLLARIQVEVRKAVDLAATPEQCIHDPADPDGCWRVRCQLGKQCAAVPLGWKLVPIEPTAEMIVAVTRNYKPHPTGTGWSEHFTRVWQQMVAAAPHGMASVEAPGWLLPEDMQALKRFCETCEDSQPYDVPKDRMRRLAEIGVIQWGGGACYSLTAFGQHVLDLLPKGWPRLPLKTQADHDAYQRALVENASGALASHNDQGENHG